MTNPGFIEFAPGDDWWPEDRVTTALRAMPKASPVQQPSEAEMRRCLTKAIESGNLSPSAIELAKKMRGDYL